MTVFQCSSTQKTISNLLHSDPLSNPIVTFLSLISSPKISSNPDSPDKTPASALQFTNNPTTTTQGAASFPSTGLQISISMPERDQSKASEELPPLSSLLSDVRPLLSRANHLKLQPDHSILGRQHRRENYSNHAPEPKDPGLINIYNSVSNQGSANGKKSFGIANVKNTRFKAHLLPFNYW